MNYQFKDKNIVILFAIIIVLAGVYLRTFELFQQTLMGDEWHAIIAAANHNFGEIYSDFLTGGHSTPIALYYSVLLKFDYFNEYLIYLPDLIGGILLLLFPTFFVRRFFNKNTLLLFTAFLAFSTILIFYSRFVRPYGISTLFAFSSQVFCYLWCKNRKLKFGFLYAISAALASYFHVIAIPFVLSPFLLMFIKVITSSKSEDIVIELKRLSVPVIVLIILFIFLFGFQLESLLSNTDLRVSMAEINFKNMFSGFQTLISGSSDILFYIILLLLLLSVFFFYKKTNKHSGLFLFLTIPIIIQLIFILITRPVAANLQHIFARYIIFGLPAIFLLVSFSLTEIINMVFKRNIFRVLVTVTIAFSLVFLFPLKPFFNSSSNARHTALLGHLVYGNGSIDKIAEDFLPNTKDFYEMHIKTSPENTIIVESPFHIAFYALHGAQFFHHKNILIGYWNDDDFKNLPAYTHANIDALKHLNSSINIFDSGSFKEGFSYIIIFHKQVQFEDPNLNIWYNENYHNYLNLFVSKFGEPFYEDDYLVGFRYRKKYFAVQN